MKKENQIFDFETISVFLILSLLTGAFLFGMQLVLFAPSSGGDPRPSVEIRGQKAP